MESGQSFQAVKYWYARESLQLVWSLWTRAKDGLRSYPPGKLANWIHPDFGVS